ncbi:MAG: hypothetical protein IJW00_06015, partial [Clostridia bacterium]|nr:hypothetical protein [Clostridia bacterium]
VATKSETIGQFGYQFNGGTPVYDAAWTHATEQPVIDAAKQLGGVNGSRMKIFIPVAGLEGENSLRILYKDADGNEVCLNEITVIMPAATPETSMNVTVNAAGNFGADAAVDATVNMTDSNLKDIFTTVTHAAGDQGVVVNAADGAYYKAQGFSEAFVKMDGKYAYGFHILSSAKKQMSSFFVRGSQVVHSAELPEPDPDAGLFPISNYYETDGQPNGHAGAGIQVWAQKRVFLGIKYYDPNARTKIGTAYFLIEFDARDADVMIIDNESVIYVTVNGDLVATIELIGAGKSYDDVTIGDGATFCEKAIVTLHKPLKEGTADEYGFHPDENGQCVIENTLVVDTPMSDIGVATRTGTLDFTEISVKPLSSVEIPTIPGDEPEEPQAPAVVHVSQDEMYFIDGNLNKIEGTDVYAPGQYDSFNGVVNYTQGTHAALADWGWVALNTENYQFGYILDGGELMANADYTVEAGDDVKAEATRLGASTASRFKGIVLVSWFTVGEHNVKFVVQVDGGEIITLREYTVIVTAA